MRAVKQQPPSTGSSWVERCRHEVNVAGLFFSGRDGVGDAVPPCEPFCSHPELKISGLFVCSFSAFAGDFTPRLANLHFFAGLFRLPDDLADV